MAAVTAAIVGGVATAAAAGISASQAAKTPASGQPAQLKQIPMNPQDQAMRDYFDRLTVANADKTYPSFAGFLNSGGDPSKAQFPLTMPNLTPNEASALGFVGGKGEAIPGVSQASVSGAPGVPQTTQLTSDQMFYMAKERARQAQLSGQKPGPWASSVMANRQAGINIANRIANLQQTAQTPGMAPARSENIQDRIERLTNRQGNIEARRQRLLQPGAQGGA